MAKSIDTEAAKALPVVKQYYVAVGSLDVKMPTLVDLLLALQTDGPRGLAIVCSSRDSLDRLIGSLVTLRSLALHVLHADMVEETRTQVLSTFTEAVSQAWAAARASRQAANQAGAAEGAPLVEGAPAQPPPESSAQPRTAQDDQASKQEAAPAAPPMTQVLATTDACLRAAEGQQPNLGLQLVISLDLPARKDLYTRRLAMVLGGSGPRIAVHFVVAGEMAAFRALEVFAGVAAIDIMPVHVADIFAGSDEAP